MSPDPPKRERTLRKESLSLCKKFCVPVCYRFQEFCNKKPLKKEEEEEEKEKEEEKNRQTLYVFQISLEDIIMRFPHYWCVITDDNFKIGVTDVTSSLENGVYRCDICHHWLVVSGISWTPYAQIYMMKYTHLFIKNDEGHTPTPTGCFLLDKISTLFLAFLYDHWYTFCAECPPPLEN